MKILVLTDNEFIFKEFLKIIEQESYSKFQFDFFYSPKNLNSFSSQYKDYKPLSIKDNQEMIIDYYGLVLSLHSKQIFPERLVHSVRCINVHPGYNPYNRGWFPQVFSIINNLPIGVTIHEMDEYLDHGPVISQEKIEVFPWETSADVYKRILSKEIEMLDKLLPSLLDNCYKKEIITEQGNINLKRDFNKLCKIDLHQKLSMEEAINYLRALSFPGYRNAYFIDDNGNKIYLELKLSKDN